MRMRSEGHFHMCDLLHQRSSGRPGSTNRAHQETVGVLVMSNHRARLEWMNQMLSREPRNGLASPREINGTAFDRFTFVHFGSGVLMSKLGLPFWATCIGAVAWEIAERPLKDKFPGAFPHAKQDRWTNVTTDTLAVLLGWGVGRLQSTLRRNPTPQKVRSQASAREAVEPLKAASRS